MPIMLIRNDALKAAGDLLNSGMAAADPDDTAVKANGNNADNADPDDALKAAGDFLNSGMAAADPDDTAVKANGNNADNE